MNTLIQFRISNGENIKILVPHHSEKFNYFYKPTNQVHWFDEIMVIYSSIQQTMFLEIGMLDDSACGLRDQFTAVLNNQSKLPKNLKFNSFGLLYNYDVYFSDSECYELYKTPIDYFDYALLSFRSLVTWIYGRDGCIYFEISQKYPFLFREPALFEPFISFEDFMKDYKPLKVIKLEKAIIKQWSEKLAILIEQVNSYKAEGEL